MRRGEAKLEQAGVFGCWKVAWLVVTSRVTSCERLFFVTNISLTSEDFGCGCNEEERDPCVRVWRGKPWFKKEEVRFSTGRETDWGRVCVCGCGRSNALV